MVRRVAEVATVPLTIGGGINDLTRAAAVLQAGATRFRSAVGFQTATVYCRSGAGVGRGESLWHDAAQNSTLPSGYEVFIDGGRTATGVDAAAWARQIIDFGVETILPTSKSTDGVRSGYDLPLIRAMRRATGATIVASGGAGELLHFVEAVRAGATILLAASVFHFNIISIPQLKAYLRENGIKTS